MKHSLPNIVILPAVLVVVMLTGAAESAVADPPTGVVDSTCASDRTSAERSAGLTIAVVEARWDLLQPNQNSVNSTYAAQLRDRVNQCADAGLRVVLGSGVQYPPTWVRNLSGAQLRDQHGGAPTDGSVDQIFSGAVHDARGSYLTALLAAVPATRIEAIRLGTSAAGELGYPGPNASGQVYDSWWAFGDAPQRGTGLATNQPRPPMPGWVPGQTSWNGQAVTTAAAGAWFTWYTQALLRSVIDQAQILRAAGYTGAVHVPSPGSGVLPAEETRAIGTKLANPVNDSMQRGLDYVAQFPLLAQNMPTPVVIDLTSVDDATSVSARNSGTDVCSGNDASTSVTSGTNVASWSNLRFARAQVARAGLPAVGENPGPPGMQTGGVATSDSESEQVQRSPGYARACGLAALLVAFEDDLFTGRSGTSLAQLDAALGA